jgi:hypothetical protein
MYGIIIINTAVITVNAKVYLGTENPYILG